MNGIGDWIRYNADWVGDQIALSMDHERYSYADMDAAVDRRAQTLAESYGVGRGNVVALLGFNSCELILTLFACARLGALLLPMNNRLADPEHSWILRHSNCSLLLFETEFQVSADTLADEISTLRTVDLDVEWQNAVASAMVSRPMDHGGEADPVLLLYTSGTTGQPKGVVHSQRALFFNALNAIHSQEMRGSDHVLSVLPLFHSGGLNIQTTPAFYLGAQVTLLRRFDPGLTLAAIRDARPSLFLAVPPVIQAMLDHPDWKSTDLSCLRMVGTGSTVVPDVLLNAWHERGIPATQIYGMTESAPTAICLSIRDARRKVGSAGKPAMHCEARIVAADGSDVKRGERGEILIRGPNLFIEYLHAPELTASARTGDWFHTGDIGHQDDEGFYYIDDRKKDVIISGGENLFPAELENVLAEIPELAEYAVVGQPDARWGEAAVACVVLREGHTLSEDQLLGHFQGRLARFKHPRKVMFMDALPRNAMGKVLRFELRAQLAEQAQHAAG